MSTPIMDCPLAGFSGVVSTSAWPRLQPGEIHVWQASLDEIDAEGDQPVLSSDERERASRFRFERDRRRFIVGRARLRMILGAYLQCDPGELAFAMGRQGKPRLIAPPVGEASLHFNLSHSQDAALYAVTREGPVGVDLEREREIGEWAEIAASVFPPQERARIERLPADRRMRGFFEAWTRQEAFLKATGDGFSGDLAELDSAQHVGYALHPLGLSPGWVGTLASAFTPSRVLMMKWSDRPAASPFQSN